MSPHALILHATGTNRDHEAATALELAGAQPEIVPLTELRAGSRCWSDYQLLVLPGGSFEVADVCSGFGYLNSGLALGALIGYLSFRSPVRFVSYLAFVAVVFVLTNATRAFIVMAVASATEMRVLGGQDHVLFGWFLFLIVMLFLYWLAERYSDRAPGHAG